jgi:hypothetical protein
MRRLDGLTDPLATSRVLTIVAGSWEGIVGLIDSTSASDRAITLASGRPSQELAEAWVAKASLHLRRDEYAQALEAAEKGTKVAQGVKSLLAEYEARFKAARALHELGRLPAARAAMETAVALAEQAAAPGAALEAQGGLAWELIVAGRLDEGCALARQGEDAAYREGLVRIANVNAEQELAALIWRGLLAEARLRLDGLTRSGFLERRRRWFEVDLRVAVGDLQSALAVEERTIETDYAGDLYASWDALRRVELFEQLGNVAREVKAAQQLLALAETESPVQAAMRARCALQALCAAAAMGRPVPEWLARAAAHALAVARQGSPRTGPRPCTALTSRWRKRMPSVSRGEQPSTNGLAPSSSPRPLARSSRCGRGSSTRASSCAMASATPARSSSSRSGDRPSPWVLAGSQTPP